MNTKATNKSSDLLNTQQSPDSGYASVAATSDEADRTVGSRLLSIVLCMACAGCALSALDAGLWLRQTIWVSSEDTLRFMGDVRSGWSHGQAVLDLARADAVAHGQDPEPIRWISFFHGLRASYDDVIEQAEDGNYRLDYTPLRLLVMSAWVKHIDDLRPGASDFSDQDVQPLLKFNTACELAAALVAGVIVYRVLRRNKGAGPEPTKSLLWCAVALACVLIVALGCLIAWQRGNALDALGCTLSGLAMLVLLFSIRRMTSAARAISSGMLAGLLIWFNPAILLDAHAWPQWDAWPLPFVLLSFLCLIEEWPFAAGAFFIIGAMLKGQVLLVWPMWILWPLLAGRFGYALRVFVGSAAAMAAITSIWLLQTGGMVIAVVVVTAAAFVGCSIYVNISGKKVFSRLADIATAAAGIGAASTFLLGYYCGGSFSWFRVCFDYGIRKFDNMHQRGTFNLATILADGYHWRLHDLVRVPLVFTHVDLELKAVLIAVYALCLASSCCAAAMLRSRNDPVLFLLFTGPFIAFYSVLGQMHSRYLLFGAAFSSLCVACGSLGTILSLATTLLATLPILRLECFANPDANPGLLQMLDDQRFFLSWATLVLAGIYLAVAWLIIFRRLWHTARTATASLRIRAGLPVQLQG